MKTMEPRLGDASRVLLIEDSPGDADLTRELLSEGTTRFAVRHTTRLADALDLVRREPPDAVLLDLHLPDAEGLQGLDALRAAARDVPIVVLTGLDDEMTAAAALHRGAQDYLVKGHWEPATFERTLRHAIERQRIQRELDAADAGLREANARLERLSLLDPLTELFNRRGLQQALSRERGRRLPSHLFALLVDLDNFKQINDSLGYAVGDLALKDVAARLRGALRPADYPARIGGDEFLVLLPETRPAEGARIAERVRLAISESVISLASGTGVRVTASVGALPVADSLSSVDELLPLSHFLLRRGKQEGKNRVVTGPLHEPGSAEEAPLADIRESLARGHRLTVVKQPIVRLADRSLAGVEILSRMVAGVFALPDDFFRVALESNMLTVVDHQCYRNCLAAAAPLPAAVRCHVNLFPSTLVDIPVRDLLDELPPGRPGDAWCIEISEKQILGDPAYLEDAVRAFRRAGVRIAVDDVGFGRSCLESLIALEPDVVKIDRGCVTGVAGDRPRHRFMRRLVSAAQALDAEIVAEGIETEEDFRAIQDMGIGLGQGFLLGRPA